MIIKCKNCGKELTKNQIIKKNVYCCKGCGTSWRQKSHDPDIFQIKNTDVLYYLLGLIFTDGNLDKDEKRITLSLTQKDVIDYLYPYFCDINKRKIYQYQPHNCENASICYTIINTNQETINKLKKMSLQSANSTTKTFPLIPLKHMSSFLRGVFDGDGCIFNSCKYKDTYYKKISITCGSKNFSEQLIQELTNLGIHSTLVLDSRRKHNANKTYYICINSQQDVWKFYSYIYTDANIFMNYKKQRFDKNIV